MPNYVPGSGASNAKLMVIAESPGKEEDEKQECLVGPTGKLHDELLLTAGKTLGVDVSRNNTYRTNVVKYRPPNNKVYTLPDKVIEEGKEQCEAEIAAIKPNVILALGDLALNFTTGMHGITKWRGSILQSRFGPKVVGTLHPAGLLYQGDEKRLAYSARTYIQLDYIRAVEESLTKELNLPERNLEIAKNSLDVYRFINYYRREKRLKRLVIDLETPKCVPVCMGLAFNSYHALSVPLLNVYGIEIPETELVEIWRMLGELFEDEELEVCGQNLKFDHWKSLTILGIRFRNIFHDTMLCAGIINPELPRNLGFLSSWITREPFYKDEGKEFNPKKDKIERLLLYNCKDVTVTFEIMEWQIKHLQEMERIVPDITNFFYNYWMKMHSVYMDIESEGFKEDKEQKNFLKMKYEILEKEAADRMFDIVKHEFDYNSPKQVANVMYNELGFPKRYHPKTKNLTTDDNAIAGLYANHAKTLEKKEFLDNLLNIRKYSKTISTYLEAEPDYDGRMRTSYNI